MAPGNRVETARDSHPAKIDSTELGMAIESGITELPRLAAIVAGMGTTDSDLTAGNRTEDGQRIAWLEHSIEAFSSADVVLIAEAEHETSQRTRVVEEMKCKSRLLRHEIAEGFSDGVTADIDVTITRQELAEDWG